MWPALAFLSPVEILPGGHAERGVDQIQQPLDDVGSGEGGITPEDVQRAVGTLRNRDRQMRKAVSRGPLRLRLQRGFSRRLGRPNMLRSASASDLPR
jgi:hypothetical protein